MALKIFEKFSPRANPADADYPYGSIKNESVPGAKDGTPLDASWGNDMLGFTDAILDEAGITPNGSPDTVQSSQRLDALKTVARKPLELKIFQSPTDNLTKVTTFAGGVGVVYEVRKTSDNSLATIYSDEDGVTEIVQNDTANVSNGDAECVFYIANGDYTVTIGAASAGLDVGHINNLSLPYMFDTVADMVSSAIDFPAGKVIHIKEREGGGFIYTIGGTPNGFEILDAGNGNTAVAQLTVPIVDTQIGINRGSPDVSAALINGVNLAKLNGTKVELTTSGTYRTSKDVDLSYFTGAGWIKLDGWTKNNIVDRTVVNDKRPLMIEDSETPHIGGVGNYTTFFGGVSFQGTKLFVARNGAGHISFPTKIAKYLVSENDEITKGVLLDEGGAEMTFHDFRDPNLSLQRSLTQAPILSGSELTSTPLVYQHYFMRLAQGSFDVLQRYNVDAFPSDEFMWGNAVQSPNNNWLKCTYGVTGAKLNKVYLYRATVNGSDPVAWTKIQDPLFDGANECTLCYFRDKLVAITRSSPLSNGLQIRWTYDLEGLTGWSEPSYLPFTGAAPAVVQYIPESEPLFLHFSEPDSSTGYRMPSFAATYDLVDWTRQSSGQFKNYTGSGAYGGLVPNGKGSYSTMYYEEVGATTDVARVWYGSMNLEGRVYPNDSTVNFMYSQDKHIQKSTILPSGEACLGSPGDITGVVTSNSNNGYFEVIPKTPVSIRAVVMMMADSAATNVSISVTEDGVPVGTSSIVSVESLTAKLYEFPLSLTLSVGRLYRFEVAGNVQWFGRKRPAYVGSPYRAIADDYTYYSYVKTYIGGENINTHVMSHGFTI